MPAARVIFGWAEKVLAAKLGEGFRKMVANRHQIKMKVPLEKGKYVLRVLADLLKRRMITNFSKIFCQKVIRSKRLSKAILHTLAPIKAGQKR
jgi:hypothetical protein